LTGPQPLNGAIVAYSGAGDKPGAMDVFRGGGQGVNPDVSPVDLAAGARCVISGARHAVPLPRMSGCAADAEGRSFLTIGRRR